MKSGIIRRVDDLGRIAIPKEIRRKMCIKESDPVEICLDGDKLYLEKYIAPYEYEKYIMGIIERIMSDGDFTDDQTKVISHLKDACVELLKIVKERERERKSIYALQNVLNWIMTIQNIVLQTIQNNRSRFMIMIALVEIVLYGKNCKTTQPRKAVARNE